MVSPAPTGPHPKLPQLLARMTGFEPQLKLMNQYYTGTQQLSFLAPEVQRAVQRRIRSLAINWCRLVVNSLEERLDVDGFRLAADQGADKELWRIWQANDLDEQSQMAHIDALVHGRAFAIVWADPDDAATPKITVESAEQMTVDFEPGTTNVVAAAKHWAQDDTAYATLYLQDSIVKYSAALPSGTTTTTTLVSPSSLSWSLREDPIPHNLGVVPVVPFINRPRTTHPYGESELIDVIALVDAINKLATDMMVSAEYHAMPRRWMTGIDMGDDRADGSDARVVNLMKARYTDAAPGRVWGSSNSESKFGQFAEASLDNFVKGIEMLAAQIAAIAGLPPHYVGLMSQANPASADAIRSAEASLIERVKRKQRVFGGSWERVMRLALLVRDSSVPVTSRSMETIWRKPETPSVAQEVDAAVKLDGIGMPFRQTLEGIGFTPTKIERALNMRRVDALADVEAQLKAVDKIVQTYGISRAAALSVVGLEEAAKVEATVEARAPGPGVTTDAELAAEVAAATPVVGPDGSVHPSPAADAPIKAPVA